MRNTEVERVAHDYFLLRPVLVSALEHRPFTPEGQAAVGTQAANYLEYWKETFGDRWYDMTAIVRLGTAIETGLRDYFLGAAPGTKVARGLFQRLVAPADLQAAFLTHSGVDLAVIPEWGAMREIMLHRHLYAHRAGVLDEQYLDDHLAVTGVDIRPEAVAAGYPVDDTYWFRPLRQISEYIEAARRFFRALP